MLPPLLSIPSKLDCSKITDRTHLLSLTYITNSTHFKNFHLPPIQSIPLLCFPSITSWWQQQQQLKDTETCPLKVVGTSCYIQNRNKKIYDERCLLQWLGLLGNEKHSTTEYERLEDNLQTNDLWKKSIDDIFFFRDPYPLGIIWEDPAYTQI